MRFLEWLFAFVVGVAVTKCVDVTQVIQARESGKLREGCFPNHTCRGDMGCAKVTNVCVAAEDWFNRAP